MAVSPEPRNEEAKNRFGESISPDSVEEASVEKGPLHQPCDACTVCRDYCGNPVCKRCDQDFATMKESGMTLALGVGTLPSYTLCQVRRHNHAHSAWLVCGDDIYDATEYMNQHPGGTYSILRKAGGVEDCSKDLMFHSRNGRKIWKKYLIGKLRQCPGNAVCEQRRWWQFWM